MHGAARGAATSNRLSPSVNPQPVALATAYFLVHDTKNAWRRISIGRRKSDWRSLKQNSCDTCSTGKATTRSRSRPSDRRRAKATAILSEEYETDSAISVASTSVGRPCTRPHAMQLRFISTRSGDCPKYCDTMRRIMVPPSRTRAAAARLGRCVGHMNHSFGRDHATERSFRIGRVL
jgi:hypothetical protein